MAQQNFKVVPVNPLTDAQKVSQLQQYLSANYAVAIEDHELEKAAQFQTYLEALASLKK